MNIRARDAAEPGAGGRGDLRPAEKRLDGGQSGAARCGAAAATAPRSSLGGIFSAAVPIVKTGRIVLKHMGLAAGRRPPVY